MTIRPSRRSLPSVCQAASFTPTKEMRLAETETVLHEESAEQAVRTVVCREIVPGPKKDRWHPLLTTSLDVLTMFRSRQHHEQAYRVGVYDEALDAVPCGYAKKSPDPKRPRFARGALQLVGWLVALVYNAVADVAQELGRDWEGSHLRTVRRTFINRAGMIYKSPDVPAPELFGGYQARPGSAKGVQEDIIGFFHIQSNLLPESARKSLNPIHLGMKTS